MRSCTVLQPEAIAAVSRSVDVRYLMYLVGGETPLLLGGEYVENKASVFFCTKRKKSNPDNLSVHSANRLLKISRENILLGSLSLLKKCMILKKSRNGFSHPFKGVQAQTQQSIQALLHFN